MSCDVVTTEMTTEALEAEIASSAGSLNLAHARLTRVAAVAMRDQLWGGTSVSQWLTYQAGITTSRADQILAVAHVRDRFPVLVARFDAESCRWSRWSSW